MGAEAEHEGSVEHFRGQPSGHDGLVIDCDRCSVRGAGCSDCVVTVLLGGPPFGVELDEVEQRAIDVLSDAGLVPPLRMVEAVEGPHIEPA
ncbi:MAG TPA: hypothetical protein VH419_08780 [Nocardioidaceae bacterium]|jgi:hypothetical protein